MIVKSWKWIDMENKMSNYGDILSSVSNVTVEYTQNEKGEPVPEETVDISSVRVEIVKETERAVLLSVADTWKEWFPKSAIVEW